MCLHTKKQFPTIAEEEIPVYKVLYEQELLSGKKVYHAPFRGFLYEKGTNVACGEEHIIQYYDSTDLFSVYGGYLHAYQSKEVADRVADVLHKLYGDEVNPVVITMYIPKGTKYYSGSKDPKNFLSDNDICAKQLVWKEE